MEEKEQKNLILIDAYNLIYRAFYGNLSKSKNKDGIPTNAISTVAKMLMKIRKENKIDYTLAVFDGGNNFRNDLDEEYKKNRKEMPEELKIQFPYIRNVFNLLGFPMYNAVNEEADDVIGTLSKRASKNDFKVYILSSDKDFRSLIDKNISVVDMMNDIIYDEVKLYELMNLRPEQVTDYLCLIGDSADNVKGIDKCGKKTAILLLNKYGNLDGIIENAANISGVVGKNIREAIENGDLNKFRKLIQLKNDVEINLKKKDIVLSDIKTDEWLKFCEEMDFVSFLNNKKVNFVK